MASSYGKSKGRRSKSAPFIGIPHHVLKSDAGKSLTAIEMRLLVHLLLQYNGRNNGNLSPTFSIMKEMGWSSSGTLFKAKQGLEHKGFIVMTKQGSKVRGDCTLVAVTWNGIDDPIKWEYEDDIKVSPVPLNYFQLSKDKWKIQPSVKPP